MSWIAHSNAPLLGAQAVVDVSGLSEQFRDGQKLRQEYEARQQQKALNEIMKVGDHNGRLELAQQHKYAGALVPQLQKYEEDRQKAALDNLKTSADIGKVYGETGKLGAETGEIGVKTMGQTIKNMTDKYSQISAGALTQNPQYFALMLGDFQNAGLINPEQKGSIIDMMMKDPENAAKVMQQLARGTIEGFKATAPEAKVLDGKDAAYMYTVDGFTGEAGEPTQRVAYGVSATDQMKDATSRANNQYTVDAGERNSERSLQGTMYNADTNYQGRIDTANISANTASEKTAVDWYKAQTGAAVAQQNAETNRIKANKTGAGGSTPRPVAATKEMSKHLTNIKSNAHTIRNTSSWIKRIESGELNLGAMANSMNSLANRTGVNSLGSNPAAYAEFKANMVKLASDALRLNAGVQTDMDYKRAMEEMQAGTYIPRNNETALALLTKVRNDFNAKTAAEYASYADYKREYDGITLPEYGKSPRRQKSKISSNKSAKASTGQALGKKIFGGG
ncbi:MULTISPECIES: hypothetical protein [unclassified Psychrobacter]|uniref:hypothetical protein n=1 Tax=unclassified Psychrobacter TaxID=196806 RepID=UPI0025D3E326|nr:MULTISPECIES: hypothetical protein [unclassified Psychrobacter]